ncbi:hypothetical protein [Asticcacaulis sp. 201]|uniref:hypothetical protein n=1 Tax=Asticcacaulis sp. 201 TaxID=3028787 RepID=UPI0029167AAF|nr:hypothetical protein [Asticcacaulis sp. 201]MDV6331326.1 hypothetical protein [Asticcacaulis sp. 201]
MCKIVLSLFAVLFLSLAPAPANAMTQCQVKMLRVWADSNGVVWFDFANNTGVGIGANNSGREAMMSLAVTALVSGRDVILRYQADNADCNVTRTDFLGMYLL